MTGASYYPDHHRAGRGPQFRQTSNLSEPVPFMGITGVLHRGLAE